MGYGGGYLHSGLSGIAGERYAADDLRVPERTGLTQTAQGGTTRALYDAPRIRTKVYGKIPFEEIEGHQVDPFYDVRGGGLGQVPTMVSGRRIGRPETARVDNATPPLPNEVPNEVLGLTEAPVSWLALGFGVFLLGRVLGFGKMMKGR